MSFPIDLKNFKKRKNIKKFAPACGRFLKIFLEKRAPKNSTRKKGPKNSTRKKSAE
jgi:hypothetical protein